MDKMRKKGLKRVFMSENMEDSLTPNVFPSPFDHLDLRHHTWQLEMDVHDFDEDQIANILSLPITIFKNNQLEFFWNLLQQVLINCSLSLIQKTSSISAPEMALVGTVNRKRVAIPLWILKESTLLGFEVLSEDQFSEEKQTPLAWVDAPIQISVPHTEPGILTVSGDLFFGNKIFLTIQRDQISVASDLMTEMELFSRITQTEIPELDQFETYED